MEEATAGALPTGKSGVRAVFSPYEALNREELAQYRKAVMESGLSGPEILEWRLEKHGRELWQGGRKVGEALPESVSFPPWESTTESERRWRRRPVRESVIEKTMMR